jgi:hypothetical protein
MVLPTPNNRKFEIAFAENKLFKNRICNFI